MMIFEKFFGNILYYPGCMMKFVTNELNKKYKKVLRKIGIDFIELKDLEFCCGSPLLSAGYSHMLIKLAKRNLKLFKRHGIKKIITPCPACFKVFSQDYPKILKDWNFEVEHITQTILNAIKRKKMELKDLKKMKITYHDPCYLGRYSKIYEEPRKILTSSKCKLIEMEFNKEKSFCCGGGGLLRANFPKLAKQIAIDRIEQAKKTKAKILVTACPLCYIQLKENSKKIKVMEISEFLTEFSKD